MESSANAAELFGYLFGFVIVLAIPVLLIVLGGRRKRASAGARGKVLTWVGWILLALVVLGILGSLSQNAGTV